MDLALHLKIKPNLYVVVKSDLSNRNETSPSEIFSKFETFTSGELSIKPKKVHQDEPEVEIPLDVNAAFELSHSKD
jgi:hypothetical protein